jgi:hypothetical protein
MLVRLRHGRHHRHSQVDGFCGPRLCRVAPGTRQDGNRLFFSDRNSRLPRDRQRGQAPRRDSQDPGQRHCDACGFDQGGGRQQAHRARVWALSRRRQRGPGARYYSPGLRQAVRGFGRHSCAVRRRHLVFSAVRSVSQPYPTQESRVAGRRNAQDLYGGAGQSEYITRLRHVAQDAGIRFDCRLTGQLDPARTRTRSRRMPQRYRLSAELAEDRSSLHRAVCLRRTC